MKVTRRDFLEYVGVSATALGLSLSELGQLFVAKNGNITVRQNAVFG
jgi:hypothetical protein